MTTTLDHINSAELGERLRFARSKAGLTQEAAAQALSMARTTLVALEKGQRRLRPDELRQLAAVYKMSVNAFLRSETVNVSLAPRFRAIPGADVSASESAAVLLNDLAAAEVELEHILGIKFTPNYPPQRPVGPGDVREQAEDAAIDLRQRLGLGLAPITDLVTLLELDLGVRVFIRPLVSGSISGLFVYDDAVGACMLLNRNHPRERRSLTAAHELAHLITTRDEADVVESDHITMSREERFATAFSLALLMPAALIRRRFTDLQRETGRFSPRHLVLLAHQISVSEEALCRRLEDLRLLPGGTWESLRDRGFSGELARRVLGDKAESNDNPVPPRLWFLASEAHKRGLLSEGQIARMLRTDRLEVRAMIDAVGVEEWDDFEPLQAEQ